MYPNSDTTNDTTATPSAPKKRRGFAAMDPESVREIARKGGLAAHARGRAHRFTPEEARSAGRKGGHAAAAHRARTGKRGEEPKAREPEGGIAEAEPN